MEGPRANNLRPCLSFRVAEPAMHRNLLAASRGMAATALASLCLRTVCHLLGLLLYTLMHETRAGRTFSLFKAPGVGKRLRAWLHFIWPTLNPEAPTKPQHPGLATQGCHRKLGISPQPPGGRRWWRLPARQLPGQLLRQLPLPVLLALGVGHVLRQCSHKSRMAQRVHRPWNVCVCEDVKARDDGMAWVKPSTLKPKPMGKTAGQVTSRLSSDTKAPEFPAWASNCPGP